MVIIAKNRWITGFTGLSHEITESTVLLMHYYTTIIMFIVKSGITL